MEWTEKLKSKIALVFPGQGCQYVGMGKDLYQASPGAQAVFQLAEQVLGFDLSRLCFEGPEERLADTYNAQPAILATSVACLSALRERLQELGSRLTPRFVAGHSLGEYTALVAAGSLDFKDALRLVRERGRLMKESGDRTPGGMAAVIGLSEDKVAQVCQRAASKGIVAPANFNSPEQTVISGEIAALTEAMQLAMAEGAKKAVRLAISIASHSPLMRRAAEQLTEFLNHFEVEEPEVPVVSDISARVITSVEDIRRELSEQICRTVQWAQSVRLMLAGDVSTFVEVGPGQALSGLIRRIGREAEVISIGDKAGLDRLIRQIG